MKILLGMVAAGALLGVPEESAVDRVAAAIARGVAAEASQDGGAMLAAARSLEALGPRVDPASIDLAAHWREQARLRGVIDRLPPVRGRALGPAYSRGTLPPGATLSTEQTFLAGQKAEVALVPQPGRTLKFRITRGEAAPICERVVAQSRASCGWLPVFTRRVQIRVTNPGTAPVTYYLVSN